MVGKLSTDNQCITVRQRTTRYPIGLYSAIFLCTFSVLHCGNLYFLMLHVFHVAIFSCCTFFIRHHFHVAPFCVVMFPCCTFFCVPRFLLIALFHVALLHVVMCSFCILLLLHSSDVAIFSCCTFQKCCLDPYKHLRCRILQQ